MDQASTLQDWERRLKQLDERLRPIANRTVDITQPGLSDRLRKGIPPLDEAGIRDATEVLLSEIVEGYARGADEQRAAIRHLFVTCRAFSWAAALSVPRTSRDGLRRHLILFSVKDLERDSRDALLTLGEICAEARAAGVDIVPVLNEVALMSSTEIRIGTVSTRQMLWNQAQRERTRHR